MLIATLLFLAAAGTAPGAAPAPANVARGARAVDPAIIEMTYDAFVALEESPGLAEIVRPAVFTREGRGRAVIGASRAVPIS